MYPHQAGDAYIILAIVVARVTTCKACAGIPRPLRVFRAYIDDEQELRMLLTCSVTVSFSPMVIPRIFMVVTLLTPETDGCEAREGILRRTITTSRVLA